ncbi:MAG: hypothetical protein J5689_02950 [Clostridia bacterium]|nr:hypothetical protein [Clostridia bacterium]
MNLMNLLLAEETVISEAYQAFKNVFSIVMPVLLGVVLIVAIPFVIILGINYSKAEDSEKREEAKKRLVGAIVGAVVAGVMVAVLWVLISQDVFAGLFQF